MLTGTEIRDAKMNTVPQFCAEMPADILELLLAENEPCAVHPVAHIAPKPATDRYFIRCKDCLAINAHDVPRGFNWWHELPTKHFPDPMGWSSGSTYPICPCGGTLEDMGKVQRSRLVHQHEESVCDDRCTQARGPNCDCKCGGENHGSKRTIVITRDAGGIPQAEIPCNVENGRLYREAKESAWKRWYAKYSDVQNRKQEGWIRDFDFYLESERARGRYLELCAGRTTARTKKLNEFLR